MRHSSLIIVLRSYPEPPCQKGHCRCGEIKDLGWGAYRRFSWGAQRTHMFFFLNIILFLFIYSFGCCSEA